MFYDFLLLLFNGYYFNDKKNNEKHEIKLFGYYIYKYKIHDFMLNNNFFLRLKK
jgi:hypothetical protein